MLLDLALFSLLAASAIGSPLTERASTVPTAQLKNGTVSGVHSSQYNQDFFLGLPYAQPPTGSLRFANPVSLNSSFKGTYDASRYSNECVGYGSDQWNYNISEDCLYLNVIKPAGSMGQNLPVALWIHGGGFSEGGSPDQRYNLSFMVQNSVNIGKPIIGVSINYRLSAWGFLSSNELTGSGNTNMGLRDQRLALHWVQENIAAFGGDPSKVTIWGESAGGASVGFHLTAYGGRNDKLFRAAIMESGNPIAYAAFNGTDYYQPIYNSIVRAVNCSDTSDTLMCLRSKPYAQLNAAINATNSSIPTAFNPIIDGDFNKKYGSIQLSQGEFVKVPIIDGANSDEGTSFSPQGINTTADFLYQLTHYRSPNPVPSSFAQQILQAYPDDPAVGVPMELPPTYRPGPPYGAQFRRSAAYYGDAVFIAPRRQTVATWAAAGVPAYSYRFNARPTGIPQDAGVPHFQEVSFVFYNIQGVGYLPAATPPFMGKPPSYAELSRQMDSSWVSFVHDLDPNTWRSTPAGKNVTGSWPVYSVQNPQNFVWDANVTSYAEPDTWRAAGIALINSVAAGVYHR